MSLFRVSDFRLRLGCLGACSPAEPKAAWAAPPCACGHVTQGENGLLDDPGLNAHAANPGINLAAGSPKRGFRSTCQTFLEAQLIQKKVLNCIFGVRTLFSARLETNSFEDGLARNAHRVSSAIRRNFGRNFAQLGRKSAQPSAILTTAQILVTTLAPSRWLPETFRALFSPKTFEH